MTTANNYDITTFKTIRTFMKVGSCSETLMNVIDRAFDHPLPAEERAVMPLAGGIAQQGYQCGMIWGAALAAGAEAYRRYGGGEAGERRATAAAMGIVSVFRERFKSIDCLDVSGTNWKDEHALLKSFLKGGPILCMKKTGNYSTMAIEEIRHALSEDVEMPTSCTGCAKGCTAKLAQMIGLSEMHTTMLANFAGGIGLSGGGCGALAAAIWINELDQSKPGENFKETIQRAAALVEQFQKWTAYEFECHTIAGRQFDTMADHSDYVTKGGCAELLAALAQAIQSPTATRETGAPIKTAAV